MKLLHHRMPLWVWNVHILSGTCHQSPRSAEKFNNGDFLSTICSVCAYCVLLTIPMDYHLHGSRAMRGLATLSVPSMPNTTHETERKGQMTRCTKTFQGLPVLYRLIPHLSFFRRLLLCAFHSGRLPNKPVCECVQGWKGLKYWRKQRADVHRMQEKGLTKPHFCCHNYV